MPILSLILWLSCQCQEERFVRVIDKATLKAEIGEGDLQLVDVRTAKEFANGHIANALNIDINGSDFQNNISKLDKEKPVFLYCKKGGRSHRAANLMKELGFQKIYDYSGGYDEWSAPE